jgi:hypothetical protein
MPIEPLVPPEFNVPLQLDHAEFKLRQLMIGDVVKDYDAVMSSVAHLRGIFGPKSNWPAPDLSLEQDLIDLGWHHKEFQRRTSFAYTMLSRDETLCLGCVYIYPTEAPGFDAEVICWVRASHSDRLDRPLYAALREWLAVEWPFRRVAYRGREHPWPGIR